MGSGHPWPLQHGCPLGGCTQAWHRLLRVKWLWGCWPSGASPASSLPVLAHGPSFCLSVLLSGPGPHCVSESQVKTKWEGVERKSLEDLARWQKTVAAHLREVQEKVDGLPRQVGLACRALPAWAAGGFSSHPTPLLPALLGLDGLGLPELAELGSLPSLPAGSISDRGRLGQVCLPQERHRPEDLS